MPPNPTVTFDGTNIGRISRRFANEGEAIAYLVGWCVAQNQSVNGTLSIGAEPLYCWPANSSYHIEAGPSGDGDGEGYFRMTWLAG